MQVIFLGIFLILICISFFSIKTASPSEGERVDRISERRIPSNLPVASIEPAFPSSLRISVAIFPPLWING